MMGETYDEIGIRGLKALAKSGGPWGQHVFLIEVG